MIGRAVLLLLATTALAHARSDKQDFEKISRGRYLTVLGDCAACHTQKGGPPFAGGKPIQTPFGKVLASNITPDRETGIGALTDQQFVDVFQRGRGRGGMHLYPAMPFPYMARITRDDALAIRAYLATVQPVRHKVVEDQLPFPLDIRLGMAVWDWLFFKEGTYRPDPRQSAEWNRGAYIVEGLAHCGACHTPKNFLGGDRSGRALHGYAVQGWFAPNITNEARTGLGNWSVEQIFTYLQKGHNFDSGASGPMREEVHDSSQHMTESDLRDIALYLKGQAAGSPPPAQPVAAGTPEMKAGAAIYGDLCSGCHTPKGTGIGGMFPKLAGNPSTQSGNPASVIRVILRGARSASTGGAPTGPEMPSFAWDLNDAQIAAVATYIRNSWGNAAAAVSADRVSSERQSLAQRPESTD